MKREKPLLNDDFRERLIGMAFEDCVCIVFFAVLTTLLSEGISWALVYRKESYKRLTLGMEKATKVNIFKFFAIYSSYIIVLIF